MAAPLTLPSKSPGLSIATIPGLTPITSPGLTYNTAGAGTQAVSRVQDSVSEGAKMLQEALRNRYTLPPTVYAPKLDIAATYAKARKQAEKAVNPYFTKQLNDFLAQAATLKQQQKTQYETNVKNYEDTLAQTLEQNQITQGRTAEDVATNQGEINQSADEFQTDAGKDFEANRLELAKQSSTGGLGAQKQQDFTQGSNTLEQRQTQKFQVAREQQDLFKSRSFEDIARSGKLATKATEKGKKQVKFDLDSYIQNAKFQEKQTRNDLEESRVQRIASESQNKGKLLFNQYLSRITNPAQYEAAIRTYGSSF